MALLALQDVSNGATVTPVAAAGGGDQIPQGTRAAAWNLGVALLVINDGVGAIDVTVAGHTAVNIPAAGTALIPVYGVAYGSARNVTYSGVTSVTVAALKLS